MLRTVLVANRGEIAVRVLRACREMGLRTIAVHSTADRDAMHVRLADEAYELGPPEASKSYLRIDKILEVARRTDADAIHPGYGFLAENPAFARACEKAGIAFVGPPSRALGTVGDKLKARRAMVRAGIPVTPGMMEPVRDLRHARREARRLSYPVIVKATAAGGGIGMAAVRREAELEKALRVARSAAQASFGNPDVFLEKFQTSVRHVEVQVLVDGRGKAVHLGERECSIQRRHQKLIEEAPSPAVSPEQREAIGALAVKALTTVGYRSAGTVEFLYARGRFFFNEVNARLQVEHPVTEMVTHVDLVKAQLGIAAGKPLAIRQEGVHLRGWAVECRINAEDPYEDFAPSPGVVTEFQPPLGPGIRTDTALFVGAEVSPYYDPLVAKVIAHGATRAEVIARMRHALGDLVVRGIRTNVPFHRLVLEDSAFRSGRLTTGFLDARRVLPRLEARRNLEESQQLERIAALAAALSAEPARMSHLGSTQAPAPMSRWKATALHEGVRRAFHAVPPRR